MTSQFLTGAVVGAMVAGAAFAIAVWPPTPGLAQPSTCDAPTCKIPITIIPPGLFHGCRADLSSLVTMPRGVTAIEWSITTPGYSFVPGGNAVTMLNDQGDFAAPAATPGTFRLSYTAPTTARGYTYNVNIAPNSDAGKFCPVPTLPRVKNE